MVKQAIMAVKGEGLIEGRKVPLPPYSIPKSYFKNFQTSFTTNPKQVCKPARWAPSRYYELPSAQIFLYTVVLVCDISLFYIPVSHSVIVLPFPCNACALKERT